MNWVQEAEIKHARVAEMLQALSKGHRALRRCSGAASMQRRCTSPSRHAPPDLRPKSCSRGLLSRASYVQLDMKGTAAEVWTPVRAFNVLR